MNKIKKTNFHERAKKLGHATDKGKLTQGASTTIMVQSLEELKELLNEEGVKYPYFETDKLANANSPEMLLIDKVYRYIFGGENQLTANDINIIQGVFPLPVQAISRENLKVEGRLVIESNTSVINNYETVTFEDGSYIDVISTDWKLCADNVIIEGNPPSGKSRINILGKDGDKGQSGRRGNDGNPGTDGGTNSYAVNGGRGENAKERGGFGQVGFQGIGNSSAAIQIKERLDGTLSVRTKSGSGGEGGDGGDGGKGGNGGHGGNVYKGACENITGGNAGKGGDGSDGGNGGKGGDGGTSTAPVTVSIPLGCSKQVVTETESSTGGKKGSHGAGGACGEGNIGGYGNCKGSRGNSSNAGSPGKPGCDGDEGKPGTSSKIDVI
jgi:hypothetical protein